MFLDILMAALDIVPAARAAVYALDEMQLSTSLEVVGEKIKNLEFACRHYGYEIYDVVPVLAQMVMSQQVGMS